MKPIHAMGLFALSGLIAACSLNALDQGSILSIRIEESAPAASERGSQRDGGGLRVTPQASSVPPESIADFDCIAVNVIGPGIADSSDDPEPNLGQIFDRLVRRESYCSYRGIIAGPLSATATVPQEVSLIIPPAASRLVQLVGFDDFGGSNDCQIEFTPGMQPPVDANGKKLYGEAFEIGRAVVDLFQDRTVSIVPDWNGLSAAEREARRISCGSSGPAPSPTPSPMPSPIPSFGLGYFAPVNGATSPRAEPGVIFDPRLAPTRVQVVGGDGTGTAQSIDPDTMSWSASVATGLNNTVGSAVVLKDTGADHLALIGGAGSPANIQFRGYNGSVWSGATTIPAGLKAGHSSPLVDSGSTYFFGAWGPAGVPSANVWKYTHANGATTALGSLQQAKYGVATAIIAPGKMIAVGGFDGSDTSMNSCDRIDGGVLSACTSYPFTVSGLAVTGLPGEKVLAVGGYSSQTSIVRSEVYIYDGATDVWTPVANLPTPRMNARAFPVYPGSRVLLVGGQSTTSQTSVSSQTYFYDLVTNTWTAGPPLTVARNAFGAVQIPDGRVIIIGGRDAADTEISGAEVWEPN